MHIVTLGKQHTIKNNWTVIAGPCSAEDRTQIIDIAKELSHLKVDVLRAGLWKPRTHIDSWQGVGEQGLEWMQEARKETGIAIATEVKDEKTLEATLRANLDILWIGSRNGQNYALLEAVGKMTSHTKIPIILKRNMGADLDDWLGAAEYIAKYNPNVILCERGIKGFPRETRNVLDLQIAKLAQYAGFPVIIDVSHAAGRRDLITPMALAVKAAGFNGLMVEVHQNPDSALSDSKQQINTSDFKILSDKLALVPNQI